MKYRQINWIKTLKLMTIFISIENGSIKKEYPVSQKKRAKFETV